MSSFKLVSDFKPQGDQPQAIEQLVNNFNKHVLSRYMYMYRTVLNQLKSV